MFTSPTITMPASATSWPASALTRLWIKFKDGGKKHFHSYDTSGRYTVTDPQAYGIRYLRKRVLDKYTGKVEAAILYDNQTGKEMAKWVIQGELTQAAKQWS